MSHAPLDELDDDALDVLAAFRAEQEIPADVHDRVWARVRADVAPPSGRWSSRGLVLGGLAAAAAIAVLWAGGRALRPADTRTRASQAGYERAAATSQEAAEVRPHGAASEHDSASATNEGAANEGTAAEPEPPPEPAGAATARDDAASAPTAPEPTGDSPPSRRKPDRRSTADSRTPHASTDPPDPQPPTQGSTLAEENRLLAQARAALLDHRPERALQRLDEHARRFPSGMLSEERQALRAVALCEAGRELEGKAQARTFLLAHPQAALAQRVRSACLPSP